MSSKRVLAVLSIKGHDEQLPRKYLRKLAGRPLLQHTLDILQRIDSYAVDILVVTDDEGIEAYCLRQKLSALLLANETMLSGFNNPHVLSAIKKHISSYEYQNIIWMLPDCPLLDEQVLSQALDQLNLSEDDAVYSVSEYQQGCWDYEKDTYLPKYSQVANNKSQLMHREISSFFMMKYSSLDLNKGYLGKAAKPFFVQSEKSLEIFGYHDLWAAEQILKRQKILFVVSGYPEIGMGHVFRALKLAQEMVHYEVCFLCDEKSDLAYEYIQEYRYPVWQQKENSLLEEITTINPDLVINDILNTSINYVLALKNQGYLVVNFEDVGEGASHADLVINALYDETEQKNSLAGEGYFVMRDEFLSLDYAIKEQLKNILLTFGGSDPNNQTLRVLKLLIENNAHNSVTITVVTGPGYNNEDSLKQYLESLDKEVRKQIEWICGGTKKLSVYMHEADLVFSSAGRTVFELAGVGVPAIILAVNERETKHAFAKKSGFKYLGLYSKVSDQKIVEAIESLKFLEVRKSMQAKVKAHNLHQGVEKIVGNIEKIIELKEVN